MSKNIYNNNQNGVGKSIYNIEQTKSSQSTTGIATNIQDLISTLQPDQSSSTANVSSDASNISSDIITTNVLTVIDDFYMGSSKILNITLGSIDVINQQPLQKAIITTNNFNASTLTYTSILLNVPYIYTIPDYAPNAEADEAPDNYLELYDSKIKVTGPFAEIESQKVAITSPILALSYIDRVKYNTTGSGVTDNINSFDKGISFEYTESSNISIGFMGYSSQVNRFVFYKNGSYNGSISYDIYKNGASTGETGLLTEYNITRYDNTSLTEIEADVLYTNQINSSDQLHISSISSVLDRSLTINSYGLLEVNVKQDSEGNTGTFNYNISVEEGNINEKTRYFNGNYFGDYKIFAPDIYFGDSGNESTTYNITSKSINLTSTDDTDTSIYLQTETTGGIKIKSGSLGTLINSIGTIDLQSLSTSEINLNTLVSGNNVNIGNTSTIKLDNYAQIGKYASIGTSLHDENTIFDIKGDLIATGEVKSINIQNTITSTSNDNIYGLYSKPDITTAANSNISIVANMILCPSLLTMGSLSTIENSSTLYIDGVTETGQNNYSIYSKNGNINFGGNDGNVSWDGSGNVFEINNGTFQIIQNTNKSPYLIVNNNDQYIKYYTMITLSKIGLNYLYIDGISEQIKIEDNKAYEISGNIMGVQDDGLLCSFNVEITLINISGTSEIKQIKISENNNDSDNFGINVDLDVNNFVLFGVDSNNAKETNWKGHITANMLDI